MLDSSAEGCDRVRPRHKAATTKNDCLQPGEFCSLKPESELIDGKIALFPPEPTFSLDFLVVKMHSPEVGKSHQ